MRFVALLGGLSLLLSASTARAADDGTRREAREAGYAGVEAFQAGDFATAHDRLEKAYALLPVPSLGLWSARALVRLGRLVEAEARYGAVVDLPASVGDEAVQREARADAQRERVALAARIPRVVVRVERAPGADIALTVDDRAVAGWRDGEAVPVDPGRHRIEAASAGMHASIEIAVDEGERKPAIVRFSTAGATATPLAAKDSAASRDPAASTLAASEPPAGARAPSDTRRVLGWTGIIAGGAGIAAGAVAGTWALSKKGTLDESPACTGSVCRSSQHGSVDSYNNLLTVSTVGLIAGAVLGAAGAYLLATSPPQAEGTTSAHARVRRGPAWRLALVPGGALLSGEY